MKQLECLIPAETVQVTTCLFALKDTPHTTAPSDITTTSVLSGYIQLYKWYDLKQWLATSGSQFKSGCGKQKAGPSTCINIFFPRINIIKK